MDVKNIARKNEFLYGVQRVVFFEPFMSLISGGGFVLG